MLDYGSASPFQVMFRYTKRFKKLVVITIATIVLAVGFQKIVQFAIKIIVDFIENAYKANSFHIAEFLWIAALLLVSLLLESSFWRLSRF